MPTRPTQENISQLMQQTTRLSHFAFFCLPGFFIVALTAIMPFNVFLQSDKAQNNTLTALIPSILGCTFLLALMMSLLAVVILLGSGDLKKQIAFFSRNPTLENDIQKRMKRLRTLRVLVVLLFIIATICNMSLSIGLHFPAA